MSLYYLLNYLILLLECDCENQKISYVKYLRIQEWIEIVFPMYVNNM